MQNGIKTQKETVRLTVVVPKALDRRLELHVVANDSTKQQFVADAIEAALAKEEINA
jgi:hypothetical protein